MLLSICMMVKNEEKNLPRCLESLKELMNNVESELIIVDTGSEDETVNIAKEYTSNVYFHKWNNNFSEMRNISINYAKGDWIFIIDADEELIEPASIISFFSKDTSKFNGAALRLDNIVRKAGDLGSTILTVRFFRNNGKYKYLGTVHNVLNIDGNICELTSKLLHYGYITDDQELMDMKFNRTRNMLIDELTKNPKNIYYQFQLATTYEMHKDMDLAKLHYEKAYIILNENKSIRKFDYIYLWGPLAKILIFYKEHHRAIEIINEGLTLADDYIDLYYFLGIAYSGILDWDRTIQNFETYLSLLEISDTLKIKKNPAVQLYSLSSKIECIYNLTQACIVSSNWEKVRKYSEDLIQLNAESSEQFVNGINFYIRSCVNLNDINGILKLYSEFKERSENLDIILYSCVKQLSIERDQNHLILRDLSKVPSKLGYIYSQINDYINNGVISVPNEIIAYFDYINFDVEEAFFLAILENKDISKEVSRVEEKRLMEMIANCHEKYLNFNKEVIAYQKNNLDCKTFEKINLSRVLSKYLMISNFNNQNMIGFMESYFESGIEYLKFKYNASFLERESLEHFSNAEEQFLSTLIKLKLHNDSEDYFITMCDLYPEWQSPLLKWYDVRCKKASSSGEADALKSIESDKMLIDLIKNIKILINEGYEAEANAIILELKNIYGYNDQEINNLLLRS